MGKENTEKNTWTNIWKGYCRIKMNQEIYKKFKSPNIVTAIKVHRFEWFWACCKNGWYKDSKVTEGKPGRGRRKGRPRLRCKDDTESDPRNMLTKINRKGLWIQHNGHLSLGKPRPNLKGQSAKAKEEDKEISV